MDNLQKLTKQIKQNVFVIILLNNALIIGGWWVGTQVFHLNSILVLVALIILSIVIDIFLSSIITRDSTEPVVNLWKAILHVSPNHSDVAAPNLEQIKIGKELVSSLVLQVYELAGEMKPGQQTAQPTLAPKSILDDFPLPVFVMNQQQIITSTNVAAEQYLNLHNNEIINHPLNDVLNMSFSENETYESWLNDSRNSKVTDSKSWNRIRSTLKDQQTIKQFDLSAYYDKNNSSGIETIVTIFDRTDEYVHQDNAASYVAVAVHELRTPLSILRGYIEALEEESVGRADPQTAEIIHKIQACSQQLSTFVNNILNVARIEENQLTLKLTEQKWEDIIKGAGNDMQLRANVRKVNIEYNLAPNLPTVAVDRVSILEVLYNLIDNAIKYSGESNKIVISAKLHESGMVETTIQDFGIGIQTGALSNLFEKYYRNHHSKSNVGGTGLGLFLCKSLVAAHGGQIWVKSIEGKGSVFGFTLQQYSQLDENLKNDDNSGVVQVAHGWIKNHSLYKR